MTWQPGAGSGTSASALAEEFVDLVCEDPEWLRSEFEDIVAAWWGEDPPAEELSARPARPAWPEAPPPGASPAACLRPSRPGADGWARQRSPPAPGRRAACVDGPR